MRKSSEEKKKMMNKKIVLFLAVLIFGVGSFVYSKNEWNLTRLSKADSSAKAWLVHVAGDSVMVRSKVKRKGKRHVVKRGGEKSSKKASEEKFSDPYPVYEGDIIVTGVGDRATILLRDGSIIWVDSLTVFKVSKLKVPSVVPGQSEENYEVNLKLRVGALRVKVPKVRTVQKKFSVQTPKGTAAVRGTEQVVQYSPGFGLQVNVLSGLVQVETQSQGVQYASRGEKVEVSTEAGSGIQTVNQQRRSEVQKNIQIASGTVPSQTQEVTQVVNQEVTQIVAEEVQIAIAPEVVAPVPSIPSEPSPETVPLIAREQNYINSQRQQIRGFLLGGHIGRIPLEIASQLNDIESLILSVSPGQRGLRLNDLLAHIWNLARLAELRHSP